MFKKLAIVLFSLFFLASCSTARKVSSSALAKSDQIAEFEKVVGDRVFFSLDSSELSETSKAIVAQQASWLMSHNDFNVTVEGHCDERGTREYNIALGAKRAESVKNHLVNLGLSSDRVEVVSYGKERPAVIGNDEESWKQNRRSVTAIR